MYLGRVVEVAATETLFREPLHPYTQALLAEVPRVKSHRRHFEPVRGEMPSPLTPPAGCHFHPRCPYAMDGCSVQVRELRNVADGRRLGCHLDDS